MYRQCVLVCGGGIWVEVMHFWWCTFMSKDISQKYFYLTNTFYIYRIIEFVLTRDSFLWVIAICRIVSSSQFSGAHLSMVWKKSRHHNYICSLCIPSNSSYCILFSDYIVRQFSPNIQQTVCAVFLVLPLDPQQKSLF